MSGSSDGSFVAETPTASDEDRALDEAGELAADQVAFTLSMLSLATPEQKKALDELVNDVRLLADRERAARYEAKLKNNDAIRQRVTAGVYEGRVNILEDEIDKLRGQLTRLRSKFAASMAPSLKGKKRAKKGGAS